MVRTVLLVPRRADGGHRDRIWKWCRARWERLMPDVPVYEGHQDTGPFNRSAAINVASRLADEDGRWDVAVVIDADVFLSIANVRKAIDGAQKRRCVTWAHRRWRGVSEPDTSRLIRDPDTFGEEPAASRDMDLIVAKTTPISWSCCVAIPRETFDDMGGFDERFVGWGFEDGAWAALVRGLYPWDRVEGDIYHWNHERSEERIEKGKPGWTASADYARNALLGRRYMIAALRDHQVGDQPGEEKLPAAMVATHIRNLKADDARFLMLAKKHRLPDWSDWWPTLEELRDGAKQYGAEQRERERAASRGVTVVIHTGGVPERWPERREYLRLSLKSLSERVTGPIVQRVIYSDWGRAAPDLAEIAAAHGFYVAGAGHHGYTGSMQRLWWYIGKRAQGAYVFQAEDDFVYDRDVDLGALVDVLEARPHLSQVALLRHPAYQSEIDRGGILGWPLDTFTPQRLNGYEWLEHRNFWTANPSLFRRSLTAQPWPSGKSSERLFADALFRDKAVHAAFLGSGEPHIRHIGDVRAGVGY